MIIGVCGFSWSGSGALLDYLMEFNDNQVYTPEFLIAYHPDGLHDLDVNLNENCAKFLSSGVAIPRFIKIIDYVLEDMTKSKKKQLTEKYLSQIIQAEWIGLEQGQELLHNKWIYSVLGLRLRNHVITKLSPEFCWKYKPYPLSKMKFSICPENFYSATQEYVNNILEAIGLDRKKNIVLNQPFPGNNPVPYMKYFLDSKAIVVDRDPRDVYVFLKYLFPGHSYSVPLQDVEVFCTYYENMHKNITSYMHDSRVLYIKFEDMVYNYQDTIDKVNEFLNLKEADKPKKFFIPEESEANTQVFQKNGDKNEIELIEKRLYKYLYDFSSVKKHKEESPVFDDNPKSKAYTFK